MRVIVPFTRLHPAADEALRLYAPQAERVDVSGDPEAYWRLLRDLWAAGDDFVVIEHDVVIAEGTIEAFAACPNPWCACRDPEWGPPQLQCVRFRREAIMTVPDALDVPPWMRHWVEQDQNLLPLLYRSGLTCCVHSDLNTKHRVGDRPAANRTIETEKAFYAWLATFATWENERELLALEPGLAKDRLGLAFLLAPLARFDTSIHERQVETPCLSGL